MGAPLFFAACFAFAFSIRLLSDRMQFRKQLRTFTVGFRNIQQLAARRSEFRAATSSDASLFNGISEVQTRDAERSLQHLGDAVVTAGDAISGCRVYVDDTRTLVLYLLPSSQIGAESYTERLELQTNSTRTTYWAQAPFVVERVVQTASVSDLLDAHRHLIARAADGPLRSFETLQAVLDAWVEILDRKHAWRHSQDPEKLMKLDLEVLCGPLGEPLWARLNPRLRAEIPRAQLRSGPRSGRDDT